MEMSPELPVWTFHLHASVPLLIIFHSKSIWNSTKRKPWRLERYILVLALILGMCFPELVWGLSVWCNCSVWVWETHVLPSDAVLALPPTETPLVNCLRGEIIEKSCHTFLCHREINLGSRTTHRSDMEMVALQLPHVMCGAGEGFCWILTKHSLPNVLWKGSWNLSWLRDLAVSLKKCNSQLSSEALPHFSCPDRMEIAKYKNPVSASLREML